MQKPLLLAVVLAIVVIPILAARDENGRRSLKKAALLTLLFNIAYLFVLRFVYWKV
jgi:hypothetical protein